MRDYLSWLVALLCVAIALVLLGASAESWMTLVGITAAIIAGLAVQATVRRRRR